MRVVVTGGAGFIGSHLVDALVKLGHRVLIIDNLSTGKKENINPKAKFYYADITDKKRIAQIFAKEKPQAIFHFAAQTSVRRSVEDPIKDAEINILGSLNILNNFIRVNPRKSASILIFASTGGALYGEAKIVPTPEKYPIHPLSPYGLSKYTFENYLNLYSRLYQLPFVSLRFSNVYGPRQDPYGEAGVAAIFINQLLKHQQPIIFGDGRQTRDFVFVGDVVSAALKAFETKAQGVFNVGTGKETSMNELFRKLIKITGVKKPEKHGMVKEGEQRRSALDCRGIKKELNWKPKVSLDEGLATTVEWFKK